MEVARIIVKAIIKIVKSCISRRDDQIAHIKSQPFINGWLFLLIISECKLRNSGTMRSISGTNCLLSGKAVAISGRIGIPRTGVFSLKLISGSGCHNSGSALLISGTNCHLSGSAVLNSGTTLTSRNHTLPFWKSTRSFWKNISTFWKNTQSFWKYTTTFSNSNPIFRNGGSFSTITARHFVKGHHITDSSSTFPHSIF